MPVTLEQALDFEMPDGKRLGSYTAKELDAKGRDDGQMLTLMDSFTNEQWGMLKDDAEFMQRMNAQARFQEAMSSINLVMAAVENFSKQDPSKTIEQIVQMALASKKD